MSSSSDESDSNDDDRGCGEVVGKLVDRDSSLSDIASTSAAMEGNSVMPASLAEGEMSIAVENPVDTSAVEKNPSQGNDTFQVQDASQIIETSQFNNPQAPTQFDNPQTTPQQFNNPQPLQVQNLELFRFFQIVDPPRNDIINYGPITQFHYPYVIPEAGQQHHQVVQPISIHPLTSCLLESILINSGINTSTTPPIDGFYNTVGESVSPVVNSGSLNTNATPIIDSFNTVDESETISVESTVVNSGSSTELNSSMNSIIESPLEIHQPSPPNGQETTRKNNHNLFLLSEVSEMFRLAQEEEEENQKISSIQNII